MGIYKTIRDNGISITLQHSQKADTYMYFDANEALTHAQILVDGIQNTIPTVEAAANLFDYFATKRISSFSAVVASVKEAEQRETLRRLVDVASTSVKAFRVGEIIKLVNRDYKNVIVREKTDEGLWELFFPLVEFCIQYQSGISDEVFTFLASEHWFVFISYYDDLKKKLLSSSALYELVFSEENVKSLIRSKCQTLLEIAKSIPETSQTGTDCLALIRARIIALSVDILQTAADRDLLAYSDSMRRVRRYFSEINYDQQELSEFKEAYKAFDARLNNYLDTHGSVFSQKIPSDIAETIWGSKADWLSKLLHMTHSFKDGEAISNFAYEQTDEPSLVDMVSHNIDTDDYFSYSRQQKVQISGSVGTAMLMQLVNNPQYYEEYFSSLAAILEAISNNCNYGDEALISDLLAMEQSLQFVSVARKKEGAENCWSLVYGASMLIIACIEKVLRLTYKTENNVILSDEHIQLGPLLSSEAIEKVLTTDLMKGVGFYLSKYGYVGLNYRNRLAHLSDIKIDEIPRSLPYTLLYLYTCVVNGVFIHHCGDTTNKSLASKT
jgi:hypothetical protein